MIERIKSWLGILSTIADALYYLALFVFIIYPVVWITDRLRGSGE